MFPLSEDIKLWATIVGLIIAFSMYMDGVTTSSAKIELINFLFTNKLMEFIKSCPKLYIRAFDAFFGEKHVSVKCFLRSSLASIVSILIIGFVLRNYSSVNPFSLDIVFSDIAGIAYVMFLLILSIILNIIPDYFSLLETRRIIHYSVNQNISVLAFIILLDFIFSGAIYIIIAGFISYSMLDLMQANLINYYENIYDYMYHFAAMCIGGGYTIFFLSTYFTSFWMYLLLLFSIITKIVYFLTKFSLDISKYFVVHEKPFQFIGIILIIMFTIIIIITKIILFILSFI